MTKQETLESRRSGVNVDVLNIFAEHYKLASKSMNPAAALHTAYTAANNFLAQRVEERNEAKEQA